MQPIVGKLGTGRERGVEFDVEGDGGGQRAEVERANASCEALLDDHPFGVAVYEVSPHVAPRRLSATFAAWAIHVPTTGFRQEQQG